MRPGVNARQREMHIVGGQARIIVELGDEIFHRFGFLFENGQHFRKLRIIGECGAVILFEELELTKDDRQRRAQIVADRFNLPLKGAFALGIALPFALNICQERVEVVQKCGEFGVRQWQMQHLLLRKIRRTSASSARVWRRAFLSVSQR